MYIYVDEVKPLGHWLRIPFGTRALITLRGLYGLQVIGFLIPLMALPCFHFPPGLVVPAS